MSTFLFDNIVFGPVISRRLGRSLGINILPIESKLCNYNCIYCECGFSKIYDFKSVPDINLISSAIENRFRELSVNKNTVDAITFAGNGEPTIHPEFAQIVDETIRLRDKYLSGTDIIVLTNATRLENIDVTKALNKIEKAILKIDTLIQDDFELINCPQENIIINQLPKKIKTHINNIYIQTMFFKANFQGKNFDNTSQVSLSLYYQALSYLSPLQVMIYSIARNTPVNGLVKVDKNELETIGKHISNMGIDVLITP